MSNSLIDANGKKLTGESLELALLSTDIAARAIELTEKYGNSAIPNAIGILLGALLDIAETYKQQSFLERALLLSLYGGRIQNGGPFEPKH